MLSEPALFMAAMPPPYPLLLNLLRSIKPPSTETLPASKQMPAPYALEPAVLPRTIPLELMVVLPPD